MKEKRIIVIGDISYPSGSAPSNRVHLYCKALKESQNFPFIIEVSSTHKTRQNFGYLDRFEGIPFYYCQKATSYEKNFLKRNYRKVKGVISSFTVIKRLKKDKNVSVLFYSLNFIYEFVYFLFLKSYGIPIVKEFNEAPLFVIKNKKYQWPYFWFHKNCELKMYDKIIVISEHLNNYYSPLFVKKAIFQIPILVDMERFSGVFEQKDKDEKVITYIGFMGGDKDGLSNLIEALALVKEKGMSFKAQFVGSGPEEDLNRLKKKIRDLKLTNTIVFLGSKTIKEIPSILLRSDLLVLSRPDNNQAKAGFPTKLGEYLASKKPVIITKTGEISKYLIDNESAYLVEADDNESFAEKIIFALNDPNAFEIGSNGYKVANTNFNYKVYKGTLKQLFN